MLWYLANGSLNDYLKSQVLLQSQYYSGQQSQLLSTDFSSNTGLTSFTGFSLTNIDGLTQPQLMTADKIIVQLAKVPTTEFDSPSIEKRTTSLVHVSEIRFSNLRVWSETMKSGQSNLDVLIKEVNTKLATDYPALYPHMSAELYAKKHPERSETLALEALDSRPEPQKIEINQAIIASKKAKQKKRLLGKAQTRIKISAVFIDELTLTVINNNNVITKRFHNVELGSIGNKDGLVSNQLGGELLRLLLQKLNTLAQASGS